MTSVAQDMQDFESLLLALQNTLGVVVSEEQRGDLVARVQPLLAAHQLDSMASLADRIEGDQGEQLRSEILEVISVGQSKWLLDSELKNILHGYIFSELPESAKIWLLGCGQGQITYSLAMEVADFEHAAGAAKNVRIIATDVSAESIKLAQAASYSEQMLNGLSDTHKKLYTIPDARHGGAVIKDKIRQVIQFEQCDLNASFESIGPVDLILCQETLVYFSNDIKAELLQRLAQQLKPGGIFVTAGNQAIMPSGNGLERVEHPAGVFFRQSNQD